MSKVDFSGWMRSSPPNKYFEVLRKPFEDATIILKIFDQAARKQFVYKILFSRGKIQRR